MAASAASPVGKNLALAIATGVVAIDINGAC